MNCIYSEHNTQKAVWAFWPSSLCDYHDKGVPVQKSFARFVSAISMHTPVFVAVSEHEYDRARFIIPKHITMYKISYDGVYSDDLNLKWLSEDGEPRVSIGKSISHLARTVLEDLNKNHSISFSENECSPISEVMIFSAITNKSPSSGGSPVGSQSSILLKPTDSIRIFVFESRARRSLSWI